MTKLIAVFCITLMAFNAYSASCIVQGKEYPYSHPICRGGDPRRYKDIPIQPYQEWQQEQDQPREFIPPPPRTSSRPSYVAPRTINHDYHEIEVAHNDELFIINGAKFEAQTYCFGMEEGDPVIFIEGNPLACAWAEIINLRTKNRCKLWCE
jgi:hypothetical protein